MAESPNFKIPAEVTAILEQLAETLVPLADWIASKPFVPPDPDLPWRRPGGPKLSPKDLGIIEFLQHLIDDSSAYAALVQRFNQVAVDPLGLSPIPGIAQWRADRNLKPEVQFGIIKSNNVIVADGQPVVRAKYYSDCLTALSGAHADAMKDPEFTWSTFVDALVNDTCAFWPAKAPKSSAFIWQFLDDILYAMLGMQNKAPSPQKVALLVELGERRRIGNMFGPADAAAAVDQFEKKYAQLAGAAPTPLAAHQQTYDAIHPPVGSPPATSTPI